jgi:hypothetical protein
MDVVGIGSTERLTTLGRYWGMGYGAGAARVISIRSAKRGAIEYIIVL